MVCIGGLFYLFSIVPLRIKKHKNNSHGGERAAASGLQAYWHSRSHSHSHIPPSSTWYAACHSLAAMYEEVE